ncbi:MAG: The GLUG motif protein [Candidatus Hydrogenedentes bacterium ADurb.Bin179]|nr:MAG: The GLUG motif protein [Candidatus Hydrogenedentes bacterium ADurb.Bin179]
MTGTYYVGGLAGWNDGTISNSYATGSVSVTGAIIGGLVGNNSSTISNSYVTGSVSGGNNVGGLVGRNYGTISNSYVTGPVSGVDYVGGLAAGNYGTISNSYVTGPVSGDDYVSGLAGVNTGTISNSYWDKETSGQLTSAGGTGLTTAQMMQRANFTGFDFNNVWYLPDNFQGNTRPFLRSEYSTTIGNAHQLQLMDMDKGASYTLAKNIDMSELKQAAGMWGGTGASANKGFVPVGNDTNKFTGQFDGQGFTVTGLYINRSGTDYAGLFGYTDGAAISNAGITGGSVTGNYCVGGLAGYNKNSAIESSYATGVVTGNGSVGGLVGYNTNSTIESSYATGVVTGNDYAGGLAGWNNGTISNSYATGAVSGTNHVGGLVGNNSSTISNSYATGAVSGTNYVGGFVGYDDGGSSCYTANFWDTETSGTTLGVGSGNLDNVTGRATSAMMTRKTFTDAGWTFNADNWGIYSAGGDVNISYPYLSKRFPAAPQIVSGTLTGDGVAGKTVRLAKGGVDYGPSSAGANRFYYFAVDSGSIAEADPYLLYISDSAVKGGMVYKNSFNSGTNKTGSGITGGTLFIADAGLSGSGIAGIRGSLGDADYPYFPYAVSGNNITVVSGLDFETASGSTFTLNGDITASSGAITFRAATELGANTTLDTSGGNNNINFNSTLDGSYTLGLTAGTGDIVFSDQAGSASALGLVTINSAKNVTVPDAFKSAGITQKAGTGTTIFDGAVTATGDVNIKTATIDINENLVAVGKKVTLNASTLVDLASGKSITTTAAENSEAASGAVDIDATGTGAVNLSGDIITTGAANNAGTGSAGGAVTIDTANGTIAVNKITASGGASTGGTNKGGAAGAITINSTTAGNNITLNGDLASVGGAGSAAQGAGGNINPKGSGSIILGKGITIDTGATAGNITFSSVLDGTSDYAEDLTLNAGTGTVGFGRNKVTGGVKKLGNITIQSAGNVQVSSSLNAKSVSATNSGTFLLSGSSATITARDGFSVSGNARMETCGITTNGGNLTIDGTLTIWGAKGDVLTTATLTTGGGALTITGITDGTLKDSGVETLILDAGAGAINVAALGSGSDKMLTDVTIDNAGTTNFNGAVNLTGALTQSAGTGATTFKSTVATGGKLLIVTGGNIQLDAGAAITSGAAGDAIILAAGGNFINNRGSDALATTAGGSRWLVYSNDPTTDNFGSPVLASGNSAVWNKTYATYDKADAGNRYVFAASPSLTFTAKNFSKTYGEDKTAAMTGQDARDYSYTVTSNLSAGYGAGTAFSDTPWDSQFSGDPLVTSAGSAATAHVSGGPYNIGIDAAGVSEAGYTIVVHDGDSYGKLTIDKLALSGSIATGNSIYGDNLTPGAATFTNKVSGDDITAAISVDTTGLLSSSGKLKAGTHTGIEYISALTGEDADNYTYADVKGNYTVNKLALTGTAIAGVSTTYGTAKDPGAVSFTNIQSKDGTFDKVASSASLVDPSNSTSGNLKAGTYKQTATAISGADAANYSFGGFTSDANYTINTKPITIAGITASNKVYDANNSAATDTTKASGWIAGDSCSVSATGLFDNKNVGTNKTVVLTSSYTGDDKRNYAITDQATTTADINAAPLTVTANDKTKTYGEAVTFNGTEFTSTELVGGETIGLVTLASLGADANAAVAGSPYTIVASDAKNGTFLPSNYAITYNDGALTINKALLDIKANNDTKTHTGNPYRGGNGVVYTGFVNGEAENVLAGALTYGGTSQGAVNAGTYGIDPSGLTSGNYNINFTNGTLVITGGQTQKQVETVESAITSSQNSINGTQDGQGNNPGAPHTGSMGPGSGSGNIVMTTVLTTGSATGSVLTTTTFSTPVAFSTAGQTMTLSITDAPSSGAMTEVGTLPIFSQIGGATPAFQGNFVVNQSGSAVSLTPSTTGTATAIPPTTLTGEKSAPFTLTMQNGLSLQMIATVTPDGTLVVSAPDSAGEVNVQQAILMGAQVAKQSLQVELGSLSSALFVRN